MKEEHHQLSIEAHECANSIPALNEMLFAVKALGEFASALKRFLWPNFFS